MGRVPPGGVCSIVFGNDDPSEAYTKPQKSTNGHSNKGHAHLSADVKSKVIGLVNSCGDIDELIQKLQAELGNPASDVGTDPQTPGGALGAVMGSRGFQPGSERVESALTAMRQALSKRGCDTLLRLGKKFMIMDDDNSKGLCYDEFKKGLNESKVYLDEGDMQALFRHFDSDCSGYCSIDEFVAGVRPAMNDRRMGLVMQAFAVMDVNGDGALTVEDVSGRYDCSLHPDVVAGTQTEVEVLQNFLAGFDGTVGPKSSVVTPEKFVAYYANVSASIDDDDYFELVIRNVWHLSGGEGAFENTTCRRLLITHEDGSQTVESLEDDMDIRKDDLQAIKANLREQGVAVMKVSLYGHVEDESKPSIMTSTISPRRVAALTETDKLAVALEAEAQNESQAVAYKQRMAQSNVSFA